MFLHPYNTYGLEETNEKQYISELENLKALIIKDKIKIKILDKKLLDISKNIKNIKNNNGQKIKEYNLRKNLLTKNLYDVKYLIKNLKKSKEEYEYTLDKVLLLMFINKKTNKDINFKKKLILMHLFDENINNHSKLNNIISNYLEKIVFINKEINNINKYIIKIGKKEDIHNLLVINTASEAINVSRKRALTNIIKNNNDQKNKIKKILKSLKKNYTQNPLKKIAWYRFYKNNLILPFKNNRKSEGVIYEFKKQTVIISPVSGKVVFANYFKGYKNMLIIDPGFGFHVILSGLDEIYYKVGSKVSFGKNIGIIKTIKSNPSELYVEVRSKGKPINPIKWLIKE